MIKIGIIGCGKIAEKHLMGYRRLEDIEITVCDIESKIAREFGEENSLPWSSEPNDLITGPNFDAIDICTPTPTHYNYIIHALENDKHVFCEKPIAQNTKELERIKRTATDHGRIVMAGYLYRFHPAFEKMKEVISERIIGTPYYATFRLGGRGSHQEWKHKKSEGGGAINEMLVHMLDLAVWYFDDIVESVPLYIDTILKEREIDGTPVSADAEDIIVLKLETSKGVKVLCESDLITPSYMNYLEVQGTNGSMFTSILDYFPTIVFCKEPKGVYQRGNNVFQFSKTNLFERELGHFVKCIKGEEVFDNNSLDDSIRQIKILDKLLE